MTISPRGARRLVLVDAVVADRRHPHRGGAADVGAHAIADVRGALAAERRPARPARARRSPGAACSGPTSSENDIPSKYPSRPCAVEQLAHDRRGREPDVAHDADPDAGRESAARHSPTPSLGWIGGAPAALAEALDERRARRHRRARRRAARASAPPPPRPGTGGRRSTSRRTPDARRRARARARRSRSRRRAPRAQASSRFSLERPGSSHISVFQKSNVTASTIARYIVPEPRTRPPARKVYRKPWYEIGGSPTSRRPAAYEADVGSSPTL